MADAAARQLQYEYKAVRKKLTTLSLKYILLFQLKFNFYY